MAKINANVHLTDPEGRRVVLAKGDDIPEWANVDEALVAKPGRPKKSPAKKAPAKEAVKESPPRKRKASSKRTSR